MQNHRIINGFSPLPPVDVIVTISFSTRTEREPYGGKFSWIVYEGRSYTEDINVSLSAKSQKAFSRYFNTTGKGRYKGLVLDLFNTEAYLRKKLDISSSPIISLYVKEIDSVKTAPGNISLAQQYLKKAEHATADDGIDNVKDFFAIGLSSTKDVVRLKARVQYAEDAVRVAPIYAPARVALARYCYEYAEKIIHVTTIFQYYTCAFEEAYFALKLDPNNQEASRIKRMAENQLLESAIGAAAMEIIDRKI